MTTIKPKQKGARQEMGDRYRIDFEPVGRRGLARSGQTLLDAARQAGVGLASVCGGAGTCEECRVRLAEGRLSPPTLVEAAALGAQALDQGWRLACQAEARSDVKLYLPPESLTAPQRLQLEGRELHLVPDPLVRRAGAHGLAVDMGTTKLAAYLVDLSSGVTVARAGAMNPQVTYGEDVVSRIAYAGREAGGAETLQSLLIEAINALLRELCAQADVEPASVLDAVLVGNTVMHHLAARLPVEQLGRAPYSPALLGPLQLEAKELGLALGEGAAVYLPPVVAGYVGADHVAMLLGSGLLDPDAGFTGKTVIAMDIGTNTEISLMAGGRATCCSCASGPAFEGAHISEGMRAAPGALERVRWQDGHVQWQSIEGLPPVGICGSGILDAVAALLEGGQVKASGQLRAGDSYPLVPAAQTGLGRDLVITRRDIHEIQLAKGAIRAGTEALLASVGRSAAEIDVFLVAGAFGTYLDLRSAVRTGLFPPLPLGQFQQIGNAAGVGARRMLVSLEERRRAEDLARNLGYLELASNPAFLDLFLKHMVFA